MQLTVPLVLASSSPRRQELLQNAGFTFEVHASRIDESPLGGETADAYARRAARDKALAVAAEAPAGSLVLGADTVVDSHGQLLGKPAGREDAERMLRWLSGSAHRVITGVCLVQARDRIEALQHETTLVTFRRLEAEEIRNYVASGEAFDKAGAYGIQGLASKFVTRIEGCYFNVVGLPVSRVYEMLKPFAK